VDGLAQSKPVTDRAAIEAAARDIGVVPGDPAYAFVQLMLQTKDDHATEHVAHEARLAKLLDRAESVAGGQLARTAAMELPRAVERLVLQRFRVMVLVTAGVMVALFGAGFGAGWWAGRGPDLQCSDQDGGRICYVWQVPPAKGAGGR
jgi:hypothetical protein